jgi:hypothetical protein
MAKNMLNIIGHNPFESKAFLNFDKYKHFSLFDETISDKENKFFYHKLVA